jgi:hypothetical protein
MADYPDTADGHRQRLKDQEKAGKSSAPPVPAQEQKPAKTADEKAERQRQPKKK